MYGDTLQRQKAGRKESTVAYERPTNDPTVNEPWCNACVIAGKAQQRRVLQAKVGCGSYKAARHGECQRRQEGEEGDQAGQRRCWGQAGVWAAMPGVPHSRHNAAREGYVGKGVWGSAQKATVPNPIHHCHHPSHINVIHSSHPWYVVG